MSEHSSNKNLLLYVDTSFSRYFTKLGLQLWQFGLKVSSPNLRVDVFNPGLVRPVWLTST